MKSSWERVEAFLKVSIERISLKRVFICFLFGALVLSVALSPRFLAKSQVGGTVWSNKTSYQCGETVIIYWNCNGGGPIPPTLWAGTGLDVINYKPGGEMQYIAQNAPCEGSVSGTAGAPNGTRTLVLQGGGQVIGPQWHFTVSGCGGGITIIPIPVTPRTSTSVPITANPCANMNCQNVCQGDDLWSQKCISGTCVLSSIVQKCSSQCGCSTDPCKNKYCPPTVCQGQGLYSQQCMNGNCVPMSIIDDCSRQCGCSTPAPTQIYYTPPPSGTSTTTLLLVVLIIAVIAGIGFIAYILKK